MGLKKKHPLPPLFALIETSYKCGFSENIIKNTSYRPGFNENMIEDQPVIGLVFGENMIEDQPVIGLVFGENMIEDQPVIGLASVSDRWRH